MDRRTLISGCASIATVSLFPVAAQCQEPNLFHRLWKSHPLGDKPKAGNRHPCEIMRVARCTYSGRVIEDQCAIRMGVAFRQAIGESAFDWIPDIRRETGDLGKPRTCLHLGGGRESCRWHPSSDCHFINAMELRRAFDNLSHDHELGPFRDLSQPVVLSQRVQMRNFRELLKNRNGIIYFHQYWGAGDIHSGGGHIDLWHGAMQRVKLEIYTGKPDGRFASDSKHIWFLPIV